MNVAKLEMEMSVIILGRMNMWYQRMACLQTDMRAILVELSKSPSKIVSFLKRKRNQLLTGFAPSSLVRVPTNTSNGQGSKKHGQHDSPVSRATTAQGCFLQDDDIAIASQTSI